MSSRVFFASGAVALSFGLHMLGFGLSRQPDTVLLDGGASAAQVAMLGNSFADIVAGVTEPTEPTQTVETPVTEPETVTPSVQPTTQTTSVEPAQETPQATAQTPAVTAAPSAQAVVVPSQTPPPERPETLPTVPAVTATKAPPPSVVKPIEKPVAKPPPKAAPKPTRQTKQVRQAKSPPKRAPKGSRATASKRGQSNGQAGAKATRSSRGTGASKQSGRAAVANYPGKVMRKLQRTRKRPAGRGKAVVGFKISSSGGVAGAWVIRSSGRSKLDAAAIKHIHRSAPFPKPPKGARRQFSFEYIIR